MFTKKHMTKFMKSYLVRELNIDWISFIQNLLFLCAYIAEIVLLVLVAYV
jgi:hypothetical protein